MVNVGGAGQGERTVVRKMEEYGGMEKNSRNWLDELDWMAGRLGAALGLREGDAT